MFVTMAVRSDWDQELKVEEDLRVGQWAGELRSKGSVGSLYVTGCPKKREWLESGV